MSLPLYAERNLNPKAACLKKREEEKLRLTTSAATTNGSTDPGLSGFDLDLQGLRSLSPTLHMTGTSSSAFPVSYSYTPSPPPLTPADKIPRKSDPPMKRRGSTGNLSPTLRKAKGRLIANSTLASSSAGIMEQQQQEHLPPVDPIWSNSN